MGLGPKYVNRVNSFLLESDEKRQTKKTKKNGSVKLFKFERKQSFLHVEGLARALFRCEIFLDFATVAFSFVCGKYCSIID